MTRTPRLQVTVSPAMTIALEVLCERTGLSASSQAMVLLRQALGRTIASAAVQERLRDRHARRDQATWRSDTFAAHEVEGVFAAFGAATQEEVDHTEPEVVPGMASPSLARRAGGPHRGEREGGGT